MGVFKNIVTFGAARRVERKMDDFEDLRVRYEKIYQEMEVKRKKVNKVLENVIETKVAALKSLQKISSISKNLKSRDRDFIYRKVGNNLETVDFGRVDQTISAGQVALSATKSISAGVGTALGAWALVSTVGTASTGAAIAGLSGVAATNATLAWFGGGAIAAGGGGMAAGTAVLGGIIAVPALALLGVFSHIQAGKKIAAIEEEMKKVLGYIDQIEANLLKLKILEKRSHELIISIDKARDVFEQELLRTQKELNKYGKWSELLRWVRNRLFRQDYYSESDLKLIAYIGGLATDFSELIDTPVIDE